MFPSPRPESIQAARTNFPPPACSCSCRSRGHLRSCFQPEARLPGRRLHWIFHVHLKSSVYHMIVLYGQAGVPKAALVSLHLSERATSRALYTSRKSGTSSKLLDLSTVILSIIGSYMLYFNTFLITAAAVKGRSPISSHRRRLMITCTPRPHYCNIRVQGYRSPAGLDLECMRLAHRHWAELGWDKVSSGLCIWGA